MWVPETRTGALTGRTPTDPQKDSPTTAIPSSHNDATSRPTVACSLFANAAGDSLRVGVGFNSGGAEFEAKIGLDHERLTVDEFPFIDQFDGTDCWPTP